MVTSWQWGQLVKADKVCDKISDTILDELIKIDKNTKYNIYYIIFNEFRVSNIWLAWRPWDRRRRIIWW